MFVIAINNPRRATSYVRGANFTENFTQAQVFPTRYWTFTKTFALQQFMHLDDTFEVIPIPEDDL